MIFVIFCLHLLDRKIFRTNLVILATFFVISFKEKQTSFYHNHTHVYICTDTQSNCNNVLSVMYICYSTSCLANGGVGYTVFAFRFPSSENLHIIFILS